MTTITDLYIYTNVLIVPDGTGKLLPTDEITLGIISSNINNHIDNLPVGGTLLIQTLYQYVYEFGGVDMSIIKLAGVKITTEKPWLSHNNIYCGESEKPVGYNVTIDFYFGQ
jgi:hypothetical protein